PEVFTAYAMELGLDMTQFQAAMQDLTYLEQIERDRQDGEALGVNGTPTFFVNGELVEPLSYARLLEMIEDALGE
ncbi:MAG: thioredoxin domain-containing protein, partial [Chloroflexota bacterium]|nr:thioredoxin domain-containing protein [Chloroflexota bacterium]